MNEIQTLPVLPLREAVILPGVTMPIVAGRPGTLRAVDAALATPERMIFAVTQRQPGSEVEADKLYTIGTVARITQVQRGLAGVQLLIQGERRGIAVRYAQENGHLVATIKRVRSNLNPQLEIAGLLRTMYDPRNTLSHQVSQQLEQHFGNKVYRTLVPRNVRLAEAPSYGVPAVLWDGASKGAQAYLALAAEILAQGQAA